MNDKGFEQEALRIAADVTAWMEDEKHLIGNPHSNMWRIEYARRLRSALQAQEPVAEVVASRLGGYEIVWLGNRMDRAVKLYASPITRTAAAQASGQSEHVKDSANPASAAPLSGTVNVPREPVKFTAGPIANLWAVWLESGGSYIYSFIDKDYIGQKQVQAEALAAELNKLNLYSAFPQSADTLEAQLLVSENRWLEHEAEVAALEAKRKADVRKCAAETLIYETHSSAYSRIRAEFPDCFKEDSNG